MIYFFPPTTKFDLLSGCYILPPLSRHISIFDHINFSYISNEIYIISTNFYNQNAQNFTLSARVTAKISKTVEDNVVLMQLGREWCYTLH